MLLHYADASDDYKSSYFVIFGVPYDGTSSFRHGSKFAPDEIRKSSYNLESFSQEHEFSLRDLKIHDAGNIIEIDENATVEEIVDDVEFFVSKFIGDGKFPIMLGGEHSITTGVCRALKNRDVGVIFIDAHADFRDFYLGSKFNHACVARRCYEYLRGKVVSIGVRSVSQEEYKYAKSIGYEWITSYGVMEKGWKKAIEKAVNMLSTEKIYLSLDIDGIDPAFAPGTGTPEYFGLTPMNVKNIIDFLAPRLVGFDIVEVNSEYDNGNTSILAARLIQEVLFSVGKIKNKNQ